MLRMPENIQVADGPEPARARGMRQNLVYLSILSQHHANEVQSIESPEEGARLLRFNSRRVIVEETEILLSVSRSIDINTASLNRQNFLEVRRFNFTAFYSYNVKNGSRDIRCFVKN